MGASRSCLVALVAGSVVSVAQGQIATMPPHANNFSGNTRGYWFTAPVDFRITGIQTLQAPGGTNGFMNWAVIKFDNNTPPPVFAATTNAFQHLGTGFNQPTGAYFPVSIDVLAGDVIGIYGNTATASGTTTGVNSYTATATQATTMIFGNTVNLFRSGMQFHLGSATSPQGMHDVWAEPNSTQISRVEFTYEALGVTGACCVPTTLSCVQATAAGCSNLGGTYNGDGSLCGSVNCPTPGACCLPDGSCIQALPAACTAQNGTYQGNSVQCGSVQCPQPAL
ncbi:MAG: hypothetical protein JNM80_02230, partial [Phycisphaerae bacterium]|nr:hypothetical protein [Phycisphaerae bacterium]